MTTSIVSCSHNSQEAAGRSWERVDMRVQVRLARAHWAVATQPRGARLGSAQGTHTHSGESVHRIRDEVGFGA